MSNIELILKYYPGFSGRVAEPSLLSFAGLWFGNLAWSGWKHSMEVIEESTRTLGNEDDQLKCLEILLDEVKHNPWLKPQGIRGYQGGRGLTAEDYSRLGLRNLGQPLTAELEEELLIEGNVVLEWLSDWLPGRRLTPVERLVTELRQVMCYYGDNLELCTLDLKHRQWQEVFYQPLYVKFTAQLARGANDDRSIFEEAYFQLESFIAELDWRRPAYWEQRAMASPDYESKDKIRKETHGFSPATILAESPHLNFCDAKRKSLYESKHFRSDYSLKLGKEAFSANFFVDLQRHFSAKEVVAWYALKLLAKKLNMQPFPAYSSSTAPMTPAQWHELDAFPAISSLFAQWTIQTYPPTSVKGTVHAMREPELVSEPQEIQSDQEPTEPPTLSPWEGLLMNYKEADLRKLLISLELIDCNGQPTIHSKPRKWMGVITALRTAKPARLVLNDGAAIYRALRALTRPHEVISARALQEGYNEANAESREFYSRTLAFLGA